MATRSRLRWIAPALAAASLLAAAAAQPLSALALNPQPLPPLQAPKTLSLNPQPLPPARAF